MRCFVCGHVVEVAVRGWNDATAAWEPAHRACITRPVVPAPPQDTGAGVLREIPPALRNERGYPPNGATLPLCSIRQKDDRGDCGTYTDGMSVGEFLTDPANQRGTWCIDGGWGGPPGPIHLRWNGQYWEHGGYCGWRWESAP